MAYPIKNRRSFKIESSPKYKDTIRKVYFTLRKKGFSHEEAKNYIMDSFKYVKNARDLSEILREAEKEREMR